jgi:hypothetical protein
MISTLDTMVWATASDHEMWKFFLMLQGDDEGSTHFWNAGQLQRDYMVLHPRRL